MNINKDCKKFIKDSLFRIGVVMITARDTLIHNEFNSTNKVYLKNSLKEEIKKLQQEVNVNSNRRDLKLKLITLQNDLRKFK